MCEIDVTALMNVDCGQLSGSVFELGERAGEITWSNSLSFAEGHPVVTDGNRDALKAHFREYGAWERSEIDAWSDKKLGALVWQEAASEIRTFEDYCEANWDTYQAKAEQGSISGRLSGVSDDGKVYMYFGS